MKSILYPLIVIIFINFSFSQQSTFSPSQKTIKATRIDSPPKIDGKLNDAIWQTLPVYGDFLMLEPNNTGKERDTHKTEIKMAYDDEAVYFAVSLYDNEPDRILKQFSQRDNVRVQADNFFISINTLNDGINDTNFYVTSAGTIADARSENGREDFNFNVVFKCNISYDEKGWYAEYRIPYNALRFPEVDIQNWSINFFRRIVHLNEQYSWNYVDRQVGSRSLYNGIVTGIKQINPPVRLILFPFIQSDITTFDGDSESSFSAGLDIKYGLSDNFTLDATLIPDFGQAAFDNVTLNLGPFEQAFGENRAFFTEGTELFNRGGLFFSRRIGNAPTQRGNPGNSLEENEIVIDNPNEADVLNAVKVSGRTKNKLGIGFLNAITAETSGIIRDTITEESREVVTEGFANYNVFVLDQQFNQNSSVTLINTNVTRSGSFRDANVTGALTNLSNKNNSYNLNAGVRYSSVREDGENTTGYRTNLQLRKTKGNIRWRLENEIADDTYDSNDLGLLLRNNFNNSRADVSYEIFKPTKRFNRYRVNLRFDHRRLFSPSVQTRNTVSVNSFFSTPKRFSFGANIDYNSDEDNFFEPRTPGRFVTFSSNVGGRAFISTDFRKKFAFDFNVRYRNFFADPETNYSVQFSPRYRFSDNFLVVLRSDYRLRNKDFGFVSSDGIDVFLGQRDITSLENTITTSYNFDPYKAINLSFRNFWSTADYSDNTFFVLNDDGSRSITDFEITDNNNPNTNFNIWNVDLSFNWRFAPGSQAILLYRNQIFNQDRQGQINYTDSLSNLFEQPVRHTISLRIVYFIDYNNVKNIFKKKST